MYPEAVHPSSLGFRNTDISGVTPREIAPEWTPFDNPFEYQKRHNGVPAPWVKFRPEDPDHTKNVQYIELDTPKLFCLAHLMELALSEVWLSTWEQDGIVVRRLHGTNVFGIHILLAYEAGYDREELGSDTQVAYFRKQISWLGIHDRYEASNGHKHSSVLTR